MDGGWIWIRGSCPDHTTARLGSLPTNHSYLFLRSAEQWWKLSSGHVQVFFVEFWFWVPTYFSAGQLNRHQMGSWSSGTCVRELPEIADGNWYWERERGLWASSSQNPNYFQDLLCRLCHNQTQRACHLSFAGLPFAICRSGDFLADDHHVGALIWGRSCPPHARKDRHPDREVVWPGGVVPRH